MSKRKAEQLEEHEALKKSKEEKATSAGIDAKLTSFQAALWETGKKFFESHSVPAQAVTDVFKLCADPATVVFDLDEAPEREKASGHYGLTWGLMLSYLTNLLNERPTFQIKFVTMLVNSLKNPKPINLNFTKRSHFAEGETLGSEIMKLAHHGITQPLDALFERPQLLDTLNWGGFSFSWIFFENLQKYAPAVSRFSPTTLGNLQKALLDNDVNPTVPAETEVGNIIVFFPFALYMYVELVLQKNRLSGQKLIDNWELVFQKLNRRPYFQNQIKFLFYCMKEFPLLRPHLENLGWRAPYALDHAVNVSRNAKKMIHLFAELLQQDIAGYDEFLSQLDTGLVKNILSIAQAEKVDFLVSYLDLFLTIRDHLSVADAKESSGSQLVSFCEQSQKQPAAGPLFLHYAKTFPSLRPLMFRAVPPATAEYIEAQYELAMYEFKSAKTLVASPATQDTGVVHLERAFTAACHAWSPGADSITIKNQELSQAAETLAKEIASVYLQLSPTARDPAFVKREVDSALKEFSDSCGKCHREATTECGREMLSQSVMKSLVIARLHLELQAKSAVAPTPSSGSYGALFTPKPPKAGSLSAVPGLFY